jgi:hypothetical protein
MDGKSEDAKSSEVVSSDLMLPTNSPSLNLMKTINIRSQQQTPYVNLRNGHLIRFRMWCRKLADRNDKVASLVMDIISDKTIQKVEYSIIDSTATAVHCEKQESFAQKGVLQQLCQHQILGFYQVCSLTFMDTETHFQLQYI